MLTGTRPFRGDSAQSLLAAVLNTHPAPVTQGRPELPPEIDQIVAKALARETCRRHASMAEMAVELAQLRDRRRPPAQESAPGERRRAAVLVTLVSDYAALMEQLAPAAFGELMARVRRGAAEIVGRHGGLVNQAV